MFVAQTKPFKEIFHYQYIMQKNLQLNCKLNTGHIHKVKNTSKRYDSYLSDESKNTRIGQELVNMRTD